MKKTIIMSMVTLLAAFGLVSCNNTPRTVTVTAIGTTQAQPDMARMNITIAKTAADTKQAKEAVGQTMGKVLDLLKKSDVPEKDIKTMALNFDIEYNYSGGKAVKTGRRAEQTIMVEIKDLGKQPERLSAMIDKIVALDNDIEIGNIQFDIDNKAEQFKKSRELALQKAREKAEQYAELSDYKLGNITTISEKNSADAATLPFANLKQVSYDRASVEAATVPMGEQDIVTEVEVVFTLK